MPKSSTPRRQFIIEKCKNMSTLEIQHMEEENALPHGWENMKYEDFLQERRKLMSAKIKAAFNLLRSHIN